MRSYSTRCLLWIEIFNYRTSYMMKTFVRIFKVAPVITSEISLFSSFILFASLKILERCITNVSPFSLSLLGSIPGFSNRLYWVFAGVFVFNLLVTFYKE